MQHYFAKYIDFINIGFSPSIQTPISRMLHLLIESTVLLVGEFHQVNDYLLVIGLKTKAPHYNYVKSGVQMFKNTLLNLESKFT